VTSGVKKGYKLKSDSMRGGGEGGKFEVQESQNRDE